MILAANAGTTVSGAFVTFGTDDTAAIQSAVTAMAARGYAITMVPDGIYIVAGAASGAVKTQVAFPYSATPQSYGFEGYNAPYGDPGYTGASQLDNDGAIFCSLQTNPGGSPSVFAAQASGGLMTNAVIGFDGVTIRTPPASNIAALNLYWAVRHEDRGSPRGANRHHRLRRRCGPADRRAQLSYGLLAPNVGNRNYVRVGALSIDGYTYGLAPNECFVAQDVRISHCLQAIQVLSGYFGATIHRLLTYACPRHIVSAATSNPCPWSSITGKSRTTPTCRG